MPQGSIITVQIRIKRASCQNDFKLEQKESRNTRQSQELRLKLACEPWERVLRGGTSTCDPLGVPSAPRVGNNLGNLKSIQSGTQPAISRYESQ